MPQRFPPLAPEPPKAAPKVLPLLQALPIGELCLMLLIGLALLST